MSERRLMFIENLQAEKEEVERQLADLKIAARNFQGEAGTPYGTGGDYDKAWERLEELLGPDA